MTKLAKSSLTVATSALVFTFAIDAHEVRDVTTIDTKTTFLHTFNNENIVLKLQGEILEL